MSGSEMNEKIVFRVYPGHYRLLRRCSHGGSLKFAISFVTINWIFSQVTFRIIMYLHKIGHLKKDRKFGTMRNKSVQLEVRF